jgi:hypothetical protein
MIKLFFFLKSTMRNAKGKHCHKNPIFEVVSKYLQGVEVEP